MWCHVQVVDAAISESVFNMLEGCVPEFTEQGYDRPPSGSTISGTFQVAPMAIQAGAEMQLLEEADLIKQFHSQRHAINAHIASVTAQAQDRVSTTQIHRQIQSCNFAM